MKNLIPKTIYYCWFGGEKPQNVLDCIHNWQNMLPEYKIVEINETTFDVEQAKKDNLWFKTCYENKMWAYVADYARLKVLYERGGVYFDTDITVEKDITELLNKNKLVLGWEDRLNINIAVGVVVVAGAGNPLIKEMLDFYNEEIWHSKLYTIPQIATYVIKKHYSLNPSTEITENDDILILPQEYFYPIPIGLKERENFVTPNTYTIHWWDASWCKSNVDYFMRNKYKIKLDKLLKIGFEKKVILNNQFLKIEKLFKNYSISVDFYYLWKFRYKYYGNKRFLTLIIAGIQIPIWEMK